MPAEQMRRKIILCYISSIIYYDVLIPPRKQSHTRAKHFVIFRNHIFKFASVLIPGYQFCYSKKANKSQGLATGELWHLSKWTSAAEHTRI